MSFSSFPPSMVLIVAAILLPFIPRSYRSVWFLITSILGLFMLWNLPNGTSVSIHLLNFELIILKVDALSKIFAAIFALITFIGGVYAYHIKDTGQQAATLLYSASAIGVTFSGDFITLFIFWELMAVSSTFLIWSQRDKESAKAGLRYLLVHLFGGSLLLTGIILHVNSSDSILISQFKSSHSVENWFILVGFALNAAIPPLHAWLPDAYSRASITGSVFLSAMTTKTAVYALARVFSGWDILLIFGVVMTIYGVIFAILSNNLRELLSYHIVSQVGYMVAGVGIGTETSINGSTAHAFSHILYKALMFMGAGVVIYTTGRSKLSDLGGLAKQMPVTLILYLVGAFSISGFPLLNGFISKSIIVFAAGEEHKNWAVLVMNLAMIGTFLSTTLKLPYLTWYRKDIGIKPKPIPINMHIGMGISAFLCLIFGIIPSLLYQYLPFPINYEPYTIAHLVEVIEILILTYVAFLIFKSKLMGETMILLDFDWLYRRPKNFFKNIFVDQLVIIFDTVEEFIKKFILVLINFGKNPTREIMTIFLPGDFEINPNFDPNSVRPTILFLICGVMFIFITLVATVVL